MRRRLLIWLPLAVFALFVATVAISLYAPADTLIHSRMIGKPAPAFALPPAAPNHPGLASADLAAGGPHIVNFFASWCIPCAAESPQLLALARRGMPIDGVAIRDKPEDVSAFLAKWGDPYQRIGSDRDSRIQLALGSSGVPETFIVDGRGIVRYQHIGDIRAEEVDTVAQAYEAAKQ